MSTSAVYVSIGNSDDGLTQEEWAEFWFSTDEVITDAAQRVYGVWQSNPASKYQNACWAFELDEEDRSDLVNALNDLRIKYRQNEIAWANAETYFITSGSLDVG